jgi:hypothetical protein
LVEPATLDSINKRIAELIQQYEIQKNRSRRAILEELSELVVIRDELKKIQQRAADKPVQLSRSLPKEFPTPGGTCTSIEQHCAADCRDPERRSA